MFSRHFFFKPIDLIAHLLPAKCSFFFWCHRDFTTFTKKFVNYLLNITYQNHLYINIGRLLARFLFSVLKLAKLSLIRSLKLFLIADYSFGNDGCLKNLFVNLFIRRFIVILFLFYERMNIINDFICLTDYDFPILNCLKIFFN